MSCEIAVGGVVKAEYGPGSIKVDDAWDDGGCTDDAWAEGNAGPSEPNDKLASVCATDTRAFSSSWACF